MKPKPEPQELDWHTINPVCALCAKECKQCVGVVVVGCARFERKSANKSPTTSN